MRLFDQQIYIHGHTLTLPHQVWHIMWCLGSTAFPFPLHTFLFPSFWYKCTLVSSLHPIRFYNFRLYQMFSDSRSLVFLFLSVTNVLNFVINPLYLHSWRHLLFGHFFNDTTTFSRVFMTYFDVVNIFLHQWQTLQALLLNSLVHSFFFKLY